MTWRLSQLSEQGRIEAVKAATTKHGESRPRTPEYSSWCKMLGRCFNPKHENYALYGGRGITVCERWLNYDNFLADMGRRPEPSYSIDRYPNPDGNYEPGNCRWATQKEQANNCSRNRQLTFNGETKTTAQWAERLGIPYSVLNNRIFRGWSVEKALTTPNKKRNRRAT